MTALVLLDTGGMLPALVLSALVHEAGHLLAVKVCRGRVLAMEASFAGLCIRYDGTFLSYGQEILIAVSGPLFSLLLAFGASFMGRLRGDQALLYLAGVSFLLGAFNLLPVRQLDGGRALYMLLANLGGPGFGARSLCVISCVIIFLLLALGAGLLIFSGWNFTLLAVAVWLLISYCKKTDSGIE